MKFFKLCLSLLALFGLSLTLSSLFLSTSANASGPLPTTNTLSVISPNGSQNFSVQDNNSNSWRGHFNSSSIVAPYCDQGTIDDLNYAIANPSQSYISVAQTVYNDIHSGFVGSDTSRGWASGASGVMIWFHNGSDPTLTVGDYGSGGAIVSPTSNNSLSWAFLSIDNSGNYFIHCGSNFNNYNLIISWSVVFAGGQSPDVGVIGYIYYSGMEIIYPVGYTGGSTVPSVPPLDTSPLSNTPLVSITSGSSTVFTAIDTNFNTIDNPSFLCFDSTAPVWYYQLFYASSGVTGDLYTEGSLSSTGILNQNLAQSTEYTLVSWYSCGDSPIFDQQSRNNFTTGVITYDTHQPDLSVASSAFNLIIKDKNFNTFDGVPFTCNSSTTPLMHYILFTTVDGTDSAILVNVISPTVPFEYKLPEEPMHYSFIAYYDCGNLPDLQFSQTTVVHFEINASGQFVGAKPCVAEYFCSLNLPTYGLTQVVLTPLNFISKLPTMSCSPLELPMPHGMQNITLPCMTPILQDSFGTILLIYQTILTGLFAYYVSIKIFGNVKEIVTPRDDQIETVKL